MFDDLPPNSQATVKGRDPGGAATGDVMAVLLGIWLLTLFRRRVAANKSRRKQSNPEVEAEKLREAEARQREAEKQREAGARQREDAAARKATANTARHWWDVLGVSPQASLDEITRRYHQLMREYHPDRVAGLAPEFMVIAEQRAKEFNAAYAEAKRFRQ
jgi:DnaJ domain